MMGYWKLGKFAYGLLDHTKNALKHSTMEYRFMLTNTLAAMWCVAFGIYTAELLYIGYNIIGHTVLIVAVFFTFFVFTKEKSRTPPAPPNKVPWDLEKEG